MFSLSDPRMDMCNEPKKRQLTSEREETSSGLARAFVPASFGIYLGSSALRLIHKFCRSVKPEWQTSHLVLLF